MFKGDDIVDDESDRESEDDEGNEDWPEGNPDETGLDYVRADPL